MLLESHITVAEDNGTDPAEVAIGGRLFLKTRFAQFFFSHANGDANARLESGDPVVDVTETFDTPLPGPFAGQSINCRACHLRECLCQRRFPQTAGTIQRLLCQHNTSCGPRHLLPKTIALFKTPGLRDLGHSAPYFHTGRQGTIEVVVGFYTGNSALLRAGRPRNGAPELAGMALVTGVIAPLSAFLKALNEDYN
jgi:hypothetical protein